MRTKTWLLPALGLGALLWAMGCDPSISETPTEVDPDPDAQVQITAPGMYDGILGNKEVMFAITLANDIKKVELLAVGVDTPIATTTDAGASSLVWDSSGTPDGLQDIYLRVTDEGDNSYESAPVSVVLVNNGRIALLGEGNYGEIAIPTNYDGTQDCDEVHHFDMPTGMRRMIAVTRWQVPADHEYVWGVELRVGEGWCPHAGTPWGEQPFSNASPLINEVVNATDFPTGQWFAHLKPLNPYEHLGESLPFEMWVYLYSE